eukprot:1671053-Alexandrium_andersonii.AAC.1
MLAIAYETDTLHRSSVAKMHGKSPRQVGRIQKAVACCYLSQEAALLNWVARRAEVMHVDLLVDKLRFDETKQRLRLDLGKEILPQQSSSAPHVCVLLREALWSINGCVMSFDFVSSPV